VIDHHLLEDIDYFELHDEEDRRALAKIVDHIHVQKGARLFETGDLGNELYIVRSGQVEIFIRNVTGEKLILTVAGKGDLFGELAMLDKGPRTATAIALEDTELIVLTRENLVLFFQKKPDAAVDMIAAMGGMIRRVDDILRTTAARNVNEEVEEKLTVIQRVADWIAWFSGSMPFLALNTAWFLTWISINTFDLGLPKFDPYPFGLLTMIVSLEAIFLSIFVLISQNRQAEKDRIRSNIDYEVNVKAELEVAHLHEKTDRLHEKMQEQFSQLERAIGSLRAGDDRDGEDQQTRYGLKR
jgi:CRP/FNR family transcriptional regulator, cyclic AMP receptor protein